MVFDDKTLHEFVNYLPDSYEAMLQIKGVGRVKLRMYGDQFISTIKTFKSKQNSKKGSA